jgi:allantoinase
MKTFDLVIKNARVVRPNDTGVDCLDIGIANGKVTRLAAEIRADDAGEVFDAKKLLAFPGCVDAHMHVGIYRPLAEDAVSESKAAAMGGVTSSLNYIRTGHYYLNRGGPYREVMPAVLKLSEGRFWVDYGYHVAPIESAHLGEMDYLAREHGVTSFKIFMFYGGYGLHGKSAAQNQFLMLGPEDRYDIAHFEFVMRAARSVMDRHPELADHISVSLHCELADILNAYTTLVEREGKLTGLHAYSAARPPHSEGLAVWIASYLANETDCMNINLLHLSSRKAIDAAWTMQQVFSHIHFRREVTVGHLLLDTDCACAVHARSIRRFARARTWRRCGRPCSTARSTGSSATTPAARRSRNGRRTTPTISGSPSLASAAPNICSPACSAKGASAACPTIAWRNC